MPFSPALLGVLWSAIVLCSAQSDINNKETHQVYSYTYHFQHNGTSDPKQIIQSLLADTPAGGNVVKTFSNPHIRGFVSKGFLPAGPIGFNSPFKTRNPTLDGIKSIVDKNFKELDRPLPPIPSPESIPIPQPLPERYPDVDLEVNNLLSNVNDRLKNIQDRFPAVPNWNNARGNGPASPPVVNDNVVTRVQEFQRDIPNGKVYEKIETYHYNPPPVSNAITNTQRFNGGIHHTQEVNHQDRKSFGERRVSYFKKEYRTDNSIDKGLPPVDFGRNIEQPINLDIQNPFRRNTNGGNFFNVNAPQHNNLNRPPSPQTNNEFGRYSQPQSFHNVNQQNRNTQRNNWNSRINNENSHSRQNFRPGVNNNDHNNYGGTNNGERADAILNNVNNRLSRVHEHLNNINNHGGQPFKWDDNNDWKRNANWGHRRQPQNTEQARPESRRHFSNGHSGPVANQAGITNPVEPISVDALRSTLEALVGRKLDIPTFPTDQGNGNFHNVNGGGIERVFHVDRVFEGPNSFGRNQHRGFERNFEVNSNTAYHRANQWSTDTARRLDAQSTRDEFSKDFIDVFNEGN